MLEEDLLFITSAGVFYRAPVGSTTDGLSTPRIIRNLPGYDATGDDWWSGVIHDAAYRGFLERQDTYGQWHKANLTQCQADDLIFDAMTLQGVGCVRRHVIFCALRLFGGAAFREDRRKAAAVAPGQATRGV